jgi:formylglycine-generating enzyme required for sulfatase activity
MYDDLARRLRSLPVRGNRLLVLTEIGRTRVAIKQGDVDRAQTCLDSLSTIDGPELSRQGTLHELYSELSAAMVAAGNSAAAVTLLEQSLAVAAKNDSAAPVTLVPQMLALAGLVQPEQPVQARQYHDAAFTACMKALDAFFVPNSVERFPLNLARLVKGYVYVMQTYFFPTLVHCVTLEYLMEFGPEGMLSLLKHLEAFSRFIDRSVAEIRTQPGITPEQKQGIDQMRAAASKLAAVIAPQIPPLLVACDTAPPPPKPQPVAVRANVITNSLGMQLVPIEPGEFLMGSPADEPLGNAMEELIHPVEITRPFLIGAHEVTQSEYVAVAGRNPSVFVGDDLPVEHVSWADAAAFCKALGELPAEREAGRRYRLPTEAEWEYCCRAGAATPYHTGRRLLPSQARYAFCNRGEPKQTVSVGSYPPNAWGLHDMHGNVWEWTNDWFSATYYGSTPRGIDPAGPARGTHHTLRGGSASMLPSECHAAFRGEARADGPDGKATDSRIAFYGDFGIRVVCEVAEKDRAAALETNQP